MSRTKVLLIIEAMSGGGGKYVRDLIKNLNHVNFEIYCIYSSQRIDDNFFNEIIELEQYATLIECPDLVREINLSKDLKAYRFILKKIKEINPAVVHCNSSKAGVLGRLAAKQRRIKKIYYTPHAYYFLSSEISDKKRVMFIIIERLLSKFATTKTFCVSNSEKKQAILNKIANSKDIEVIHNGISSQIPEKYLKLHDFLNLPSDAIIIGNNARMSEQKDPWLFIEIAQLLIKEQPLYHFVWVGDGPFYNDIKNFIKRENLTNNIHLLGHRLDSEFIVANYDIFLATSLYEGLPYSLIEALRAGVPIVGKKVVGIEEIIIEDYNGSFFYKINELNDILNNIQNNPEIRRNSLEMFYNEYTLTRMINRIEAFYL